MKIGRERLLLERLESGDWKLRESTISGKMADTDPRKFILDTKGLADFYWIDVYDNEFRALLGSVSPASFVGFDKPSKEIKFEQKRPITSKILWILNRMKNDIKK